MSGSKTKKIKPQTLKGFRDFLPEEAVKRQSVIDKLRAVFELYGFNPLETPALEYAEILEGKYGDEGEKLIYKFKDRGGRDVAMRYDQTVPLARVVAQYGNELPMPFKRYQIQPVWRAEKPQAGRFREFLQCDADIVGDDSINADFEILSCLNTALQKLGFKDFAILVNSRKILGDDQRLISILDKEDKIGKKEVLRLLSQTIRSDEKAEKFYLSLKNIKSKDIPPRLKEILKKREELNLSFQPFLARGLDYYTDLIFEVKIPKYKGGSVCGGGRYDNLIGMFAGKQIPAAGFAFGFDRLVEAMEQQGLLDLPKTVTKVLVTIFSPELQTNSIEATTKLRAAGINTELYPDPETKLDKQLKYADKKGIPYVIIIGPEEIKNSTVTVKNMSSGEQKNYPLDKIPKM